MSFSVPHGDPMRGWSVAVNRAAQLGVIVVGSSGNRGNISYFGVGAPASADWALSVAASQEGKRGIEFSGNLQGKYEITWASFGSLAFPPGITGNVVLVDDGVLGEIDNIHNLLNNALGHLEGSMPWFREEVEALVEPFTSIADPELILFAEADGKTVGWFPGIPNLAEHFQKVDGLRHFWRIPQLLWLMRKQPKSATSKSVLVLPEYHKRGAAVLLFDEMAKRAHAKGYQWADMSITSEDNPDTPELADRMGAYEYKRWQVFTKPVD